MKRIIVLAGVFMIFSVISASAQTKAISKAQIDIVRAGSVASVNGSASNFTGNVRVDSITPAGHVSNTSGGLVTFEQGARTAWHSHPKGQRIIITQGVGWVQQWGGAKMEVRPGDVVWFPANVKHWHGATATTGMSHYALVEIVDGKSTDWMEHVTDSQFNGK